MFIAKCRIDLLLLVDISGSIKQAAFDNMTEFLKNFVTDSRLNVGPEGTNIGLILFSELAKTEVNLKIGEITDAQQLGNYISNLNWEDVMGRQTRTEKALHLTKGVSVLFQLFVTVWCNRMECVLRGWSSP